MRFFHYLGQSQIKMKTVLSKFAGLSALLIGMLLIPCWGHAEETATQKLLASLNLNREDIRVYQKVFDALKAQNFSESDRLTKKLNNKLLLGHILAEKYLAPKYKSNYEELALWLEQYADHPQAKRIYRLAQRKKQDRELSCPVEYPQTETFSVYHWDMRKFSGLSAANKNFLLKKLKDFRRAISRGKTKQARLILENGPIKKLLPDIYYSRLANILATKYLTDNYNRLALEWAQNAARRNNNASSRWTAGIAAWRLKEYKTAASEFSRVSAASRDDEWISSAGDFWASRAYQKQKNSSQSKTWLKKAARYPRTFYGILAARKLGEMPHYNWEKISYFNDFQQKENLENLVSNQALQRIVALIFTGQEELVRQEIGALRTIPEQRPERGSPFPGQPLSDALRRHHTQQRIDRPQRQPQLRSCRISPPAVAAAQWLENRPGFGLGAQPSGILFSPLCLKPGRSLRANAASAQYRRLHQRQQKTAAKQIPALYSRIQLGTRTGICILPDG